MLDAVLPVGEPGRFGCLVKLDGDAVEDGSLHGFHIAQGGGFCSAADVGQGPVLAIVGNSQTDLGWGDLSQGVLKDPADLVDGGYGHGRAVCIGTDTPMVMNHPDACSGILSP